MPRPRNEVPTYRLHKQSGQAVVTIREAGGCRRDILLGKFGSPESKQEYERIIAQQRVAPHSPVVGKASSDTSLGEIVLAFFKFADKHYRDSEGRPTGETANYRDTVRPMVKLYGEKPAAEFGPLALKTVRQTMVDSGLSRPVINKRINRIRRILKWAAGEELIPFEVYHRLTAVGGLSKGRTDAPEPEPVGPVPDEVVNATLPHLPEAVRVMVEVQRLTGMRPNEVCKLRASEIDRSEAVWTFIPGQHKTTHRGKKRIVAIGPKAQLLLSSWLSGESEYVFSPRVEREKRYEKMRAKRKTKVQPSQVSRKKATAKTLPGERYTTVSYRQAIQRGARLAGVACWSPNQLRHTFATLIRKHHGIEAAQVMLGHAKADVTQVYAERDLGLALKVAAEVG